MSFIDIIGLQLEVGDFVKYRVLSGGGSAVFRLVVLFIIGPGTANL